MRSRVDLRNPKERAMAKNKNVPPVPPDNRSRQGPGADPATMPDEAERRERGRDRNVEQQGRQGNISQNTHNTGYQQDR
jgi:hypothetical protein